MSEKTKTPRELADLYCKDFDPHDYGIGELAELLHSTYLVAIKAGAKMGWEGGTRNAWDGRSPLDSFYLEFDDWWASLVKEGEKTIDVIDNPTIHCRGCGCDYVADSVEKMQYHYKNCFKEPSK